MTTYKRLGDYIREVNVRNRELKVTNLLGVSISKEFDECEKVKRQLSYFVQYMKEERQQTRSRGLYK